MMCVVVWRCFKLLESLLSDSKNYLNHHTLFLRYHLTVWKRMFSYRNRYQIPNLNHPIH